MTTNPLGKFTTYTSSYCPDLLYPISRASYRHELAPSHGYDLWRCYEFSWLEPKRPPQVGIVEFVIPSHSSYIVESKSVKLYLGSFAQSLFQNREEVEKTIEKDLSSLTECRRLHVSLWLPHQWQRFYPSEPQGVLIDTHETGCAHFQVNPDLLTLADEEDSKIDEKRFYYSNLLRSLCPVTGQPDWGSVEIAVVGRQLTPSSLLQYIVSYREHQGFHEQCCEMIFTHLSSLTRPRFLSVQCAFTRRGGIDITPFRSTQEVFLSERDFGRRVRQ
jgi:7-cyano-7-deazaguanine reductase